MNQLCSSKGGGRAEGGVEGSGDATSAIVTVPSAPSTEAQWVACTLALLLLLWIKEKGANCQCHQLLLVGWLVAGDLGGGLQVSASSQWQCQEKVTLALDTALHWVVIIVVSIFSVCVPALGAG